MRKKRIKTRYFVVVILLIFLSVVGITGYKREKELLYRTPYRSVESGVKDRFYANKNVMLIVPHEDDEYTVAGGILEQYVEGGSNVRVVFTTNGDGSASADRRMNEAVRLLGTLGITENNITFLGYGDGWKTEYGHIYNAPENEIITSMCGAVKTYGMPGRPDYRSSVDQTASDYTRANFQKDIKDVILQYRPEVIYAVDLDEHYDHRCAALLFEEAMQEILSNKANDYTPMVYRGFGYCTAWDSVKDYYGFNVAETKNPSENDYMEKRISYSWAERVRLPVSTRFLGYSKRSSTAYAALSAHESQNALQNLEKIVNSDKVFWERRTDSFLYNADVKATSGNPTLLNDYKLFDTSDICTDTLDNNENVWHPDLSDQSKKVTVSFSKPESVSEVVLYDNTSLTDNIMEGILTFSDGSRVKVGKLKETGGATPIIFQQKENITGFDFTVVQYEGEAPGLCEMEAFANAEGSFALKNAFIKIQSNDNFVYDYYVNQKDDICLSLYSYPYEEIDIAVDCNVFLDGVQWSREEVMAAAKGNSLIIPNDNKPHDIRIEMLSDNKLFDEIHTRPLTVLDRVAVIICQKVETFRDNLLTKK